MGKEEAGADFFVCPEGCCLVALSLSLRTCDSAEAALAINLHANRAEIVQDLKQPPLAPL